MKLAEKPLDKEDSGNPVFIASALIPPLQPWAKGLGLRPNPDWLHAGLLAVKQNSSWVGIPVWLYFCLCLLKMYPKGKGFPWAPTAALRLFWAS